MEVPKLLATAIADDEIAVSAGGMDPLLFEAFLDSATEFAADRVLAAGTRLEEKKIVDGVAGDAINTRNFGVGDDIVGILRIVAEIGRDFLEQRNNAITVLLVIHRDVHGELCPVTGEIADDRHLAVRNHMYGAIGIAEHRATEGEGFNSPLDARRTNDVADVESVLDKDEEPVDEILNQGLGTEADREAGYSGRGEQRTNVQPKDGED